MKKVLPVLAIAFLLSGFYSCTKEGDTTSALCSDGVMNGKESEIDCGGACTPCPNNATFSCKMNGVGGESYFIGATASGQILGPSIRVYSTTAGNRPLNFMFIPTGLNEPIAISSSNFDYAGEPYTRTNGDTGHVYISVHDTLRHIISGSFSYNASRITGGAGVKCVVSEGLFTNARYHCSGCNPPY